MNNVANLYYKNYINSYNINGDKMNISWIKFSEDKKSFKIIKGLGFDVYEINDLEETDNKIEELINKKYNTIVISNEVANFSGDIIKRYSKTEGIKIIIAPSHK